MSGLPPRPPVRMDGRQPCRWCEQSFLRKSNLLQHERTHDACARTLPTSSTLEADCRPVGGVSPPAPIGRPGPARPRVSGSPARPDAPATGSAATSSSVVDSADGVVAAPAPTLHSLPCLTRPVIFGHATERVWQFYKKFPDMERTRLLVRPAERVLPSRFVTEEHKRMRLFALLAGGSGLSQKGKAEYWESTVAVERAAMRMAAEADVRRKKRKRGKNGRGARVKVEVHPGPLESAFPTASAFVRSLKGEQNRCLSEQRWRETEISVRDKVYKFFSRDLMEVATEALVSATKVVLRGARRWGADGVRVRTNTLDSDLYLTEQEDVVRMHGGKTHKGMALPVFVMGVQLFSDAALVSWNGGTSAILLVARSFFRVCSNYPAALCGRTCCSDLPLTGLTDSDTFSLFCYQLAPSLYFARALQPTWSIPSGFAFPTSRRESRSG